MGARIDKLRMMMLIRRFEARLMAFPKAGFQLLSSGEEAVAVGVCSEIQRQDQLLTSGRSIGPALARGLHPGRVMAELLGKRGGVCKGQGGRGHMSQPDAGFFGAHAVVAGNLTVAAGVALAMQMQERDAATVCMLGDGACGAGALYEAINVAALWKLPLVFVCSNNGYAVSTPTRAAVSMEHLAEIGRPFRVEARIVDGMDVEAVAREFGELLAAARGGSGPTFLECLSYRWASHSTSTRDSRPRAEVEAGRVRCPIRLLAERLLASGQLSHAALRALEQQVDRAVETAASFSEASLDPDPLEALADVD
jgi:TPP-dependent pyruvate/acetoin dehydrogenase alpha subunit